MTTIKACMSSNFGQISPLTAELAALERLKKFLYTYNGRNVVSTLVPSFLIGSFSSLQVIGLTIKALMSSNFSWIPPLTAVICS